jgi:hypothetical protein
MKEFSLIFRACWRMLRAPGKGQHGVLSALYHSIKGTAHLYGWIATNGLAFHEEEIKC